MATRQRAAKKAPRKPAKAKRTTRRAKSSSARPGGTHTQGEDDPWEINIPDHPARSDSPAYVVARRVMRDIVDEVRNFYLGSGPYQDHHGGGLWVKDDDGWFLIKNLAGMEWSQQFCADPAKVEMLRKFAQRIYRKFPQSLAEFKRMGFADAETVLNEPIDSSAKVSRWVDSIFNASVPLSQRRHTGVLKPTGKRNEPGLEGGVHHYPTPITDIQLFKRDDFQLWVADNENQLAAVVPVDHRGSGDSHVRVAFATPNTKLHAQLLKAEQAHKALILSGSHPLAKQAFATQNDRDKKEAAD
jgi:Family of unknown function (DUF6424)